MDRIKATCVIRYDSVEMVRKSIESVKENIGLNQEILQSLRSYPGGREQISQRVNTLGDYFERIEVVERSDGFSYAIMFHVRPKVDSHWRYLMMAVLRSANVDPSEAEFDLTAIPK